MVQGLLGSKPRQPPQAVALCLLANSRPPKAPAWQLAAHSARVTAGLSQRLRGSWAISAPAWQLGYSARERLAAVPWLGAAWLGLFVQMRSLAICGCARVRLLPWPRRLNLTTRLDFFGVGRWRLW